MQRLAFWLGIALVVSFLAPVWSNAHFLTGDGPCHLYNAKVLLDWMSGREVDFYARFYVLNTETEPNWLSHLILAGLLAVFPDILAEKILVSGYLIGFAAASLVALRAVAPRSEYLWPLVLTFAVHHVFQMGFYNYSMSIAMALYIIAYWLRNRARLSWPRVALLSLFLVVLYFAHPIGLGLAGLCITCMYVLTLLRWRRSPSFGSDGPRPVKTGVRTTVAALPALFLFADFVGRKGFNAASSPESGDDLWHYFSELSALITLVDLERPFALWTGILIGFLVLVAVVKRSKAGSIRPADGIGIASLCTIVLYFAQPGSLFGAGILGVRLQFIPYLLAVVWLATVDFKTQHRRIIAVLGFLLLLALQVVRIPVHYKLSHAVAEYLQVRKAIPSGSVVLPISFAHAGIGPQGAIITDRIWLFHHVGGYVGSNGVHIMLDNYEGNTGYFPLIWRAEKSPFKHLNVGLGLEHQPPQIDLANYEAVTGEQIDYVVIWGDAEQYLQDAFVQTWTTQLSEQYMLVTTSDRDNAQLYKRRE